MAWKKIIFSGSSADLTAINVDGAVTASSYTGSFTGDGTGLTGITVSQVSTVSDSFTNVTSKTVTHNFDSLNVHISVFNGSNEQIIPASTTLTDSNTAVVTFDSATSGRVVVSQGGHIVSGSIEFNSIANKPTLLSSSAQISSDISGSFTSLSSSVASDIASNVSSIQTLEGKTLLSSSAQIIPDTTTGGNTKPVSVGANGVGFNISTIDGAGIGISGGELVVNVDGSTIEINSDTLRVKNSGIGAYQIANDNVTTDKIAHSLGTLGTHSFTGSFTGSFVGDGSGLTGVVASGTLSSSAQIADDISGSLSNTAIAGLGAGIISASAFSSPNQGTVRAVINGVTTNVDTGLQTGDTPTFSGLTITGDLTVTGNTFEAQVTNLNVEDRFILVNSGSSGGDSGIIFGGSDPEGSGVVNSGSGIFWDAPANVFGFAQDIAASSTSATHTSKIGNIETSTSSPSAAPTFQGEGTIHVNTNSEDIWIYS